MSVHRLPLFVWSVLITAFPFLLSRWDVSSIPVNGILLTEKKKNAQRVENYEIDCLIRLVEPLHERGSWPQYMFVTSQGDGFDTPLSELRTSISTRYFSCPVVPCLCTVLSTLCTGCS